MLVTPSVAPEYLITLNAQAAIANRITAALGYQGRASASSTSANWRFRIGPQCAAWVYASRQRSTWGTTSVEHWTPFSPICWSHAPTPAPLIALDAGAPFGAIAVDGRSLHHVSGLCGSCPEGALADNPKSLNFASSKASACSAGCARRPARNGRSRWCRSLTRRRCKKPLVLNAAEILNCTRCSKPLGAKR